MAFVSLTYWYPDCFGSMLDVWVVLSKVVVSEVLLSILFGVVVLRGRGKSVWHLRIDLFVLGVLRVLSAVYGAMVLYQARPLIVVFAVDQMEVLASYEFEGETSELAAKSGVIPKLLSGPLYVALQVPSDPRLREQMLMFELTGGRASGQTRYFAPYVHAAVMQRARSLELIGVQRDVAVVREAARDLAAVKHARVEDVKWLPIRTRFGFSYGLVLASAKGVLAVAPMSEGRYAP